VKVRFVLPAAGDVYIPAVLVLYLIYAAVWLARREEMLIFFILALVLLGPPSVVVTVAIWHEDKNYADLAVRLVVLILTYVPLALPMLW
jgi:hypothetical protein